MSKRHQDALTLLHTMPCNPSGVIFSMQQACDELRCEPGFSGTKQMQDDPALRLMTASLAHVMNLTCDDVELIVDELECTAIEDGFANDGQVLESLSRIPIPSPAFVRKVYEHFGDRFIPAPIANRLPKLPEVH